MDRRSPGLPLGWGDVRSGKWHGRETMPQHGSIWQTVSLGVRSMFRCSTRMVGIAAGIGLLFGLGLRSSLAVPEFEAEFKALYYRPAHNAKAKAFAEAVDKVSAEMPMPGGNRMVACN